MTNDNRIPVKNLLALALLSCLMAGLAWTSSARAGSGLPCEGCLVWWRIGTESTLPTNLPPGGAGKVHVVAENRGDAPVAGSPVVLRDKLPPGLEPTEVALGLGIYSLIPEDPEHCQVKAHEVECIMSDEFVGTFNAHSAYTHIDVYINVQVSPSAKTGEENEVSISGGGGAEATSSRPLKVSAAPTPFGVEKYELDAENADGSVDTQAGSHPFQLATTISLNEGTSLYTPPALPKDLQFQLPAGLIGNPTPFPQCNLTQFNSDTDREPIQQPINLCPPDTAVGIASVSLGHPGVPLPTTITVPLFNLTPTHGEPARFGFDILNAPIYLDTSVNTGGEHNIVVSVNNITQLSGLESSRVTFWGVPGDPRHDPVRGWNCLLGAPCNPVAAKITPPLLTLPTSCDGIVHTTVRADSWTERIFTAPTETTFMEELGNPTGMSGCNRLPFSPSLTVVPDGEAASTPTGLTVHLHVPQAEGLNPEGLAPSYVKDTTVTLPAGIALNPASADGLTSCTEEQVSLEVHAPANCPESSKVATVELKTPLLPNPLLGAAYLATQNANPFHTLVAMYLVAEDPVSGVIIKVAGKVVPDPVTGQLVSTFDNTPQLPYEDLFLHFFGGARAPLATPALCGSYTAAASLAPWSGNVASETSSLFGIVSGPNGSPCASPLPFSPTLTSGSTNIQAGAFSPFTMTMSRADGQQSLRGVTLHMPPGLLGVLSNVKLCDEANANAGTCGAESQIGETIVSVGLGSDPYSTKGRVYITGGYRGAPYGLSIVTPAKAGPFDLGTVVVRAKIEVDQRNARLTVTTDESGPYSIPRILDGIPLQIQHVNVNINRPGFTFNPSNCSPMAITSQITSDQGASGAPSTTFQVANCSRLSFKPKFTAATTGKTSRKLGTSLDVKLSYPKAPWGSQANVKYVKVELPKQLPSRLTTLQKACLAATFDANPASCPDGSRVGTATATTPILPVPLTGPAYFVSYGNAKFPELVVVLSGYGTTVQLHGETFISKAGVTSSTFREIPDVPIGSFELKLPQGINSALGANANLCKSKLKMPTKFVAQNGAELKQTTPIAVTGCKAHKTSKNKAKKTGARRR